MRTILINIDAGPENCDKCSLMTVEYGSPYCFQFHRVSKFGDENMPRPAECLEAERLAKEMKHD